MRTFDEFHDKAREIAVWVKKWLKDYTIQKAAAADCPIDEDGPYLLMMVELFYNEFGRYGNGEITFEEFAKNVDHSLDEGIIFGKRLRKEFAGEDLNPAG